MIPIEADRKLCKEATGSDASVLGFSEDMVSSLSPVRQSSLLLRLHDNLTGSFKGPESDSSWEERVLVRMSTWCSQRMWYFSPPA